MEMVIQLLLLALGFFMLVKGADWFVDGSSGIADKLGVPQLVIGLTIVAMGTSAPEAAVSITAALKGSAEITIGNIVGSNILNILIILGITSAIVSVAVAKSTIRYEIPWMLFITAVLLALGYTGNQVSFMEGVILWVLFLLYLGYVFVMAMRDKQEVVETADCSGKRCDGRCSNSDCQSSRLKRAFYRTDDCGSWNFSAGAVYLCFCSNQGKGRYCNRKYRRKQYFQYSVCCGNGGVNSSG